MSNELSYSERVAIARLHALLELLPTALDHELARVGLTAFEYTLLEALVERGGSMRLSALASKTNATLPRLSRVVSSLEGRGLLRRETCSLDRRATNAILTSNGYELQAEAAPIYAQITRRLILSGLEDLPGDGVGELANVCLAILRTLDPEGKLVISRADSCPADPVQDDSCPADPCPADPVAENSCPADPLQESETE
ncbi:MarR family transcriptional regulator [Arcanobacterium haemolyticum]|nr:MarR family transcriptional regulator [Arcanobacterium haemolyticum]